MNILEKKAKSVATVKQLREVIATLEDDNEVLFMGESFKNIKAVAAKESKGNKMFLILMKQ